MSSQDSVYLEKALEGRRKMAEFYSSIDSLENEIEKYLHKRIDEHQKRLDFLDQLDQHIPAEHQSAFEGEKERYRVQLKLRKNELSQMNELKKKGENLIRQEEQNEKLTEAQQLRRQRISTLENVGILAKSSKNGEEITADESPEEPDMNAYVAVEQEPKPLNMRDIRMSIGYPMEAREAGIEGTVVVRVLVDAEGKYVRHVVLNGAHPALEESVTNQISKLTFSPAMQEGEPVKFWVNIPFAFKLIQ